MRAKCPKPHHIGGVLTRPEAVTIIRAMKTAYIVVWTQRRKVRDITNDTSHWKVFIDDDDNKKEAEEFYKSLLEKENTYTASLTKVIKSTDYENL